MIVSPMHGSAEENMHTLERLADMVGAGARPPSGSLSYFMRLAGLLGACPFWSSGT